MDDELLKAFEQLYQRSAAAYHEAGHVVVALTLRAEVFEVCVFEDGHGHTAINREIGLQPDTAWEYAWGPALLALLRDGLLYYVAGFEAMYLWDDGSSSSLISNRMAAGEWSDDSDRDLYRCQQAAVGIRRLMTGNTAVLPTGEEVLPEVLQAERRAERLLKEKWQVVETIADKLVRSTSGRLTHGRLTKLAGQHFQA